LTSVLSFGLWVADIIYVPTWAALLGHQLTPSFVGQGLVLVALTQPVSLVRADDVIR
jgi:hypothetical protein